MKNYIVYSESDGMILQQGKCPGNSLKDHKINGFSIMEGTADPVTQKVIRGQIVDKTPEEIEAEKPKPVPIENQPARITNKQWQAVMKRIENLELRLINGR